MKTSMNTFNVTGMDTAYTMSMKTITGFYVKFEDETLKQALDSHNGVLFPSLDDAKVEANGIDSKRGVPYTVLNAALVTVYDSKGV